MAHLSNSEMLLSAAGMDPDVDECQLLNQSGTPKERGANPHLHPFDPRPRPRRPRCLPVARG